ncbi:DNA-directed RNA polymerase subunit L [Candidatus Woesearchaeota archaeon]|nr:MAG: DNA-directed RNA polymerase subunit L [Candidatus Woesearchaeota archaeon]
MEIEVIEQSKKKLIFKLKGADHTFCNALKRELYSDESVKISSYTIEHPLINIPKFIVETDTSKTPEKALSAAVKRLQGTNAKVLEAFKKAKL